jgi:hypothetical protein
MLLDLRTGIRAFHPQGIQMEVFPEALFRQLIALEVLETKSDPKDAVGLEGIGPLHAFPTGIVRRRFMTAQEPGIKADRLGRIAEGIQRSRQMPESQWTVRHKLAGPQQDLQSFLVISLLVEGLGKLREQPVTLGFCREGRLDERTGLSPLFGFDQVIDSLADALCRHIPSLVTFWLRAMSFPLLPFAPLVSLFATGSHFFLALTFVVLVLRRPPLVFRMFSAHGGSFLQAGITFLLEHPYANYPDFLHNSPVKSEHEREP